MDAPAPLPVVIVTWNVRDLLDACLVSLEASTHPIRPIVVDNASTDGTVAMVRDRHPSAELIANTTNVGFTRANNQALRRLGVEDGRGDAPSMVLLLNPDTEVAPAAVSRLVRHLEGRPRAGAVGPLLRNTDGSVQGSRRRFPTTRVGLLESTPVEWHWSGNPTAARYRMADVSPGAAQSVDWVTGAAILLRSRALTEVGLFDESFFMYSEELDLCYRLHRAGWEVRFEPAAEVVHHEGRSSDQAVAARHRRFHRSRVRYFRKHHGRAAAATVRAGLMLSFGAESLLEGLKWLAGSQRPLRRDRLSAYAGVLRDALVGD